MKIFRRFVSQIIPLRTKKIVWHFLNVSIKPANIRFILTLGAVRKVPVEIKSSYLSDMNEKSSKIVEELNRIIVKIESKRYWPANYKIRFIDGMSGQSFRGFLSLLFTNNTKSYLEIGTWKGSTFCSAINGNVIEATCIDDWSQFGAQTKVAIKNISRRAGDNNKISIVAQDFREFSFDHFLKIDTDVYFYDGPHSEKDHYDATQVIDKLNFRSLLFIVDDWNWDNVRQGTFRGLNSLDLRIAGKIEIVPTTSAVGRRSRWHNGYAFFVLER